MLETKENVLLVDDNELVLKLAAKVLEPLNCNIIQASNPHCVRDLVSKNDFAVIILDILMPGKNGFQIASELQKDAKTKSIPIIFLTALEEQKFQLKGYELGCVDFLYKPIEPVILRSKVKIFIDLHHQKKELESMVSELKRVNDVLEYEVKMRKASEKKEKKLTQELTTLKSNVKKNNKLKGVHKKIKKMLDDLADEIKKAKSAKTIKLEIKRLTLALRNDFDENEIKTIISELELIPQLKSNSLFKIAKCVKDIIDRL